MNDTVSARKTATTSAPAPAGALQIVKDTYQGLRNAYDSVYALNHTLDVVEAHKAAATAASSPSPEGATLTTYNQPVIWPNGVGSAGPLDTTFNSTCKATASSENVVEVANAVAIQANGKIVAAGYTSSVESERGNKLFALARYNPDGRLDATFGANGKVTTRIDIDNIANAVAIQADGKIVAGGGSLSIIRKSFDFTLVRYNINGSLDASFGVGGIATKSIATTSGGIRGIVIQTDGKIVAVGNEVTPGKIGTFTLLRFNPDGSLDPTFGTNGKVSTNISSTYDAASAVALQADGKIVAVGVSSMSLRRGADFSVVRYNTDGSLDPTFGAGGQVTTDAGGGEEGANAVAIQADGKIVVVGRVAEGILKDGKPRTAVKIGLVRYNTNGSVDSTFAAGGMVKTNGSNEQTYGRAVAIQQNGKILVVGGPFFHVFRYTTDGRLDTSFGAGGEAQARGNSFSQSGSAIAIQADGKIVAAGTCSGRDSSAYIHDDEFSLVRYLP